MRTLALTLVIFAAAAQAQAPQAQTPPKQASQGETSGTPAATPHPVGSMSDLMVTVIYPSSDAIFYISSRTPTTDAEWVTLQGQALMVAESGNLLMMPGRARDNDQWMRDAKLMLDAGAAAFVAAKKKDVAGLEAVSDQLYESCTSCHRHYRPGYGRTPTPK